MKDIDKWRNKINHLSVHIHKHNSRQIPESITAILSGSLLTIWQLRRRILGKKAVSAAREVRGFPTIREKRWTVDCIWLWLWSLAHFLLRSVWDHETETGTLSIVLPRHYGNLSGPGTHTHTHTHTHTQTYIHKHVQLYLKHLWWNGYCHWQRTRRHEFVFQSRYYVHSRANTLGKGMKPLILPAMG